MIVVAMVIEWSATPVIGHAKDCLCSFALLVSVLGEYTASALGSLELSSSSCLQNPTSVSAKLVSVLHAKGCLQLNSDTGSIRGHPNLPFHLWAH